MRTGRRDERGTILIEAAIGLGVVFFAIFGTMEIGVFLSGTSTTQEAARDGVRYGSSAYAAGADKPAAATAMRQKVEKRLAALTGNDHPATLWIYRSDPTTGAPIGDATFTTCATSCYRYTWSTVTGVFVLDGASPGWPNPNACTSPTEQIGVYVTVTHRSLTGLLFDQTIAKHSAIRLEPLGLSAC